MSFCYDFDLFDVIPTEGEDDPALGKFMTDIGFRPDAEARKVALFRDPLTADALRGAPEALRAFFLASGFGLNTYQSGAPAGFYPEQDEEARLDIIRRLTENAEMFSLPSVDEAAQSPAFSLSEFLTALAKAQPMVMEQQAAPLSVDPLDLLAQDEEEIDLSPAFAQDAQPDQVPHDLRHPHEVQPKVIPPVFDTTSSEAAKPRKKFWQGKFFFLSIFAASTLVAVQAAATFGNLV